MATVQHFRSALGGFNRQDVVNYIEYMNNQHNAQLQQLNTQLQTALSQSSPAQVAELKDQLEAANARIAELEEQLASAQAAIGHEAELETYRRAERTEREARERAQQAEDAARIRAEEISRRANGALADASVRVEESFAQVSQLASGVNEQLAQLQQAVAASRQVLTDTAQTLYAIGDNH